MTELSRRIWAHLAAHGWPLMVGGALCGVACHFTSRGNLWRILPALVGVALVIPGLVATVMDMITTVKHWREEPPTTKGRQQ